MIVDNVGIVIMANNHELIGKSLKNIIDEEVFFDKSIVVNKRKNIPYFYVKNPIKLNNYKLYYFIIKYSPADILSIVRDYSELGKSGDVLLAQLSNNKIDFIFPPRKNSNSFDHSRLCLKNDYLPVVQALSKKQTYLSNATDYCGVKVLAITRYLDQADLGMVIKIDKSELYGMIYKLRNSYLLLGLLSLFYFIFLAFYFSRLITRPIIYLTKATDNIINKGIAEQKIEFISDDEIGELANNFNIMIERLSKSYANLEEKINNRTEELEDKIKQMERLNKFMIEREMKMIELKIKIKQLEETQKKDK